MFGKPAYERTKGKPASATIGSFGEGLQGSVLKALSDCHVTVGAPTNSGNPTRSKRVGSASLLVGRRTYTRETEPRWCRLDCLAGVSKTQS